MSLVTLDFINEQARQNPEQFVMDCENKYTDDVNRTAEQISKSGNPIILLNGPSSSGKTTTAMRIKKRLEEIGISKCYTISMDDYYISRGTYDMPRDEEGNEDYESPLCMDLELLSDHLLSIARGDQVVLPRYDFQLGKQFQGVGETIHLEQDQVVIIEGIHALNDTVIGNLGKKAIGVYISVASELKIDDELTLSKNHLRFVRRAIRDSNFRASALERTLKMWNTVMRGERIYIMPYQDNASIQINSYMPYESCVMMNMLKYMISDNYELFQLAKVEQLFDVFDMFEEINYTKYMPENSLLHEFIG